MAQNQFNPTPGVSTHDDAAATWNGNAVDAESRLVKIEATPRAVFTLQSTSVSGSSEKIPLQAIQGQGAASISAWELTDDGRAECLIRGLYAFSGAIVITDSDTTANRAIRLTARSGTGTNITWEGRRESSSSNIEGVIIVYGHMVFEVGDALKVVTNSGSTTALPGDTASRQFWVTRISG